MTVLVEDSASKKSTTDVKARTECSRIVILPQGDYTKGDYLQVTISDATSSILIAEQGTRLSS